MWKNFTNSRKLIVLLGDICLTFCASILAIAVVLPVEVLSANFYLYLHMTALMIVLNGILFNINGLFTLERKRYADILLSLAVSMFSLFIMVMALSFFIREFTYSRGVLIVSIMLQFVFIVFWRYVVWSFERKIHAFRSVMLVGSEEEAGRVINRLSQKPELGLMVKSICTDLSKENWHKALEDVEAAIICSDLSLKSKAKLVHYCNLQDKQVLLIPDIYEVICGGATLDKLDDIPVFRTQRLQLTLEQRALKRIVDIAVSGAAFMIALPLLLLTALAIKVCDPGPVFYTQIRSGRYGEPFKVYKFRTMRVDAEKLSGPQLAAENDSRITRLGHFLRATRLDELPQIWNVLSGAMSVVGPRPERPFFVEKFQEEIPEYYYRHNVKPGITGLAQVYGKYNTAPYDKLVYDLTYIQQYSVLQDFIIMLQTVKVLVSKSATEGVKHEQQEINLEAYKVENIYGDF